MSDIELNKTSSAEDTAKSEFQGYDDLAEAQKEQHEREEKSKADFLLPPDPEAILEVRHLKKHFVLKKTIAGKPISTLKAVDDVSFTMKKGETLGIVGESGCGKTTMGRTVLKLYQPTGGQVFFHGQDIAKYSSRQMRSLRTQMQIVFQDPYSSPEKHGRRHPFRTGEGARGRSQGRDQRLRHAAHGKLRSSRLLLREIPARVFGRTETEDLYRARPFGQSRICRLRRACFRARRFYSGADHQSSEKVTEGKTAYLSFHFARSFRREIHFR